MFNSPTRMMLVGMAVGGWLSAGVFAALSMFLAAEAGRGADVPWQILGAMVVGPIFAALPLAATLAIAARVFGVSRRVSSQSERAKPSDSSAVDSPLANRGAKNAQPDLVKPGTGQRVGSRLASWSRVGLVVAGVVECLLLPLTVAGAMADDDTLVLSIPLNAIAILAIAALASVGYWRRAAIGFLVVHLLGLAVATLFAGIAIVSVVVFGPLLSISGLAVALIGPSPRRLRMLVGLSTVAFSLVAFFLIVIFQISEREAAAPLLAAIVVYQLAIVPVGLIALRQMLTGASPRSAMRFGLWNLIVLMAMGCIAGAAGRLGWTLQHEVTVAVGMATAALIACGLIAVLVNYVADLRSPSPLPPSKPLPDAFA